MNNTFKLTTAASLAALGTALAGPDPVVEPVTPPANGDWCTSLKDFGKFYKNDNDPFIQELKFFGRLHLQYANVNGDDINGDSFSEDFDTVRRFRLGTKIKFFNHFTLTARANVVSDSRHTGGVRDFDYQDWDEFKVSYSRKNVAGFDKVKVTYGRHKIGVGEEARMSSKKIKTVERTALSNKIFNNRYTGLLLSAEKGGWNGTIGFLSLDSSGGLGKWDQGHAIYLLSEHELSNGTLSFDLFYNLDTDRPAGTTGYDEVGVGYKWAATASYVTDIGNWNLLTQVIYGDNGSTTYAGANRDGSFYGLIITPSTYIIEDKLEFVARYAYQGSSEDQGIRVNSRYTRANHGGAVNGGRGDAHHSIYAGLNWYLCDHYSKFMFGIEYDMLDTPNAGGTDDDVDATTLWAAYRMYF